MSEKCEDCGREPEIRCGCSTREWDLGDVQIERPFVSFGIGELRKQLALALSPPAAKCSGCDFYCKMCEVLWPRQKKCCPDCDCAKQLRAALEPMRPPEAGESENEDCNAGGLSHVWGESTDGDPVCEDCGATTTDAPKTKGPGET